MPLFFVSQHFILYNWMFGLLSLFSIIDHAEIFYLSFSVFLIDDPTTFSYYPIIKDIIILDFSHLFQKQYIAGGFLK